MKILVLIFAVLCYAYCDLENCHTIFLQTLLTEDDEICKNLYKNYTEEFRRGILSSLENSENSTCILDVFEKYNVYQTYLKGLTSQLIYKNLTYDKFEEEFDESKDAIIESARAICNANKSIDDLQFNPINVNHDDLCELKYFLDDDIIDNKKYMFDSYTNITECENHIIKIKNLVKENEDEMFSDDNSEIKETLFGLRTDEAEKCSKEKFKTQKIFTRTIAIRTMMKFQLSDAQKNYVKEDFYKVTTAGLIFLLECIEEI